MTSEAIKYERDTWVKAIKQLCVDWKRKSQHEHFYEAPERALIDDTKSESKTQDDHMQFTRPPVPPTPRPRLPKTFPAEFIDNPTTLEPEIVSMKASEPKPAQTAEFRSVLKPTSPVATCSSPSLTLPFLLPPPLPVPSAVPGPVPHAPLPPPLPMKSQQLSDRTKAFHWDLVAQDKVSALVFAFI